MPGSRLYVLLFSFFEVAFFVSFLRNKWLERNLASLAIRVPVLWAVLSLSHSTLSLSLFLCRLPLKKKKKSYSRYIMRTG